jgi:hypothetical protein
MSNRSARTQPITTEFRGTAIVCLSFFALAECKKRQTRKE